jgi:anti-anti-sigma factor
VTELLTINVELADDFTYIHARGEIDRANAQQFEQRLNEAVRTAVPRIIDLGEVTYIDSAGLRALQLSAQRGTSYLVLPRDARIYRTVMIAGINELIPIVESVADAKAL